MKEIIIKFALNWIAGITADQWKHALQIVVEAFDTKAKDDRKKWANDILQSAWPKLSESAANFLRFVAVRWATKQGLF